MTKVRTRFAPSPTGYLHIGGLRSALYAYLFAKKSGGDFVLRIEDTDQERFVEGATEIIYNTLKETGLVWDEGPDIGGDFGPYIQTDRRELYQEYAKKLVELGGAYYCFCTKDELDLRRAKVEQAGGTFKYDKHCLGMDKAEVEERIARGDSYVIRQNIPTTGNASFDDMIFGTITVPNDTLDDNVLQKADGLPTYNFANVVDDHLMEISHVMRGTEYLSSTPKYNLLYESFGWEIPLYIHMTPVMRDAQHKLSKRHGDASYDDFVKKGYLKEAILNYIALLGWNPGTNQEKFTLEEMVEAFSIDGMSKSPSVFDNDKLTWLNGEYIRALSAQEFTNYAMPWYKLAGVENMDLDILEKILHQRTEVFSQIPEKVEFLAKYNEQFDMEMFVNKKSKTDLAISLEILLQMQPLLQNCDFTETALHDLMVSTAQENGRKNGTQMWPVRIAISGMAVTPGGAVEIAALLGKEESLNRMQIAINRLKNA